MTNRCRYGFAHYTAGQLVLKAHYIVGQMTANAATFPTPSPTLPAVSAAIKSLEDAIVAANNGDRSAIALRNEQREKLTVLLRQLGMYVNLIADGNKAIAMGSGMDLVKDRQPAPSITKVNAPVIRAGVNAGELEIKVPKVEGARSYLFFVSANPALPVEQWILHTSTTTNFTVAGLDSATRYFVCVAATGINHQRVFSERSSFVTQ